MRSTATFVTKTVSQTTGTCIKSARRNSLPALPQAYTVSQTRPFCTKTVSHTTSTCKSRRNSLPALPQSYTISHTRSFYTRTVEFGSPRPVPRFSLPSFPSRMESIKLDTTKIELNFGVPKAYPREIVFLGGAPGAGKGTNSSHVAELRGYDAPTIVVSDLLNTPSCKAMKERGIMVNDDYVFDLLKKELEKPQYRNGVVVDGFPRTAKQAEFLTNFYTETNSPWSPAPNIMFVMLHIDEAASIGRQQSRGKELLAENEERGAMGLPLLEVRATDINIDASKARYAVFSEQLDAVMGLRHQFPLVVVDASSTLDAVKENLASQMATLPQQ